MTAAWGEGYFPYIFQNQSRPELRSARRRKNRLGRVPRNVGITRRIRYRWKSKIVEYVDKHSTIHVPTLILVGDHDEVDSSLSQQMHEKIAASHLIILPKSGHLTFVEQTTPLLHCHSRFLVPTGEREKNNSEPYLTFSTTSVRSSAGCFPPGINIHLFQNLVREPIRSQLVMLRDNRGQSRVPQKFARQILRVPNSVRVKHTPHRPDPK